MAELTRDDEPPARPASAPPDEPQTSLHTQTIQPEPAESDASGEPAERTLGEETRRRAHSEEQGGATERRRDEQ